MTDDKFNPDDFIREVLSSAPTTPPSGAPAPPSPPPTEDILTGQAMDINQFLVDESAVPTEMLADIRKLNRDLDRLANVVGLSLTALAFVDGALATCEKTKVQLPPEAVAELETAAQIVDKVLELVGKLETVEISIHPINGSAEMLAKLMGKIRTREQDGNSGLQP